MSDSLHPDLELIASEYDRIVAAWSSGQLSEADLAAQLDALQCVDGLGRAWRIDPQTGRWQHQGPHGWADADPSEYVEPSASQVDDWSSAGYGNSTAWDESPQAPQIPEDWGADDAGSWAPPAPTNRRSTPTYPASFDAFDSADAPPPAGYSADGYPESDVYDRPAAGGGVSAAAGRILDLARRLFASRILRFAAVALVVLVVAVPVLRGFVGGGGRDCPALDGVVLGDVRDASDQEVAGCAVAALMMTVLAHDEPTGIATFGPSQQVDRRDLARSVGSAYLALGGSPVLSPTPPDYDQLDPSARTTPAVVTAYALNFVDAPVASGDPVSVEETLRAAAKLARAVGFDSEATDPRSFLVSAGLVSEDSVDFITGPVTRIQLARFLVALYTSGAEVSSAGGGSPTTLPSTSPSSTLPSPSSTVPVEPSTTTTAALVTPTADTARAVAETMMSGDRSTAVSVIHKPGSANLVALRTAQMAGLNRDGLEVSAGAPTQDEEGRWVVTLEVREAASGAVVAQAAARLVEVDGVWKFNSWPNFEPYEPPAEEG